MLDKLAVFVLGVLLGLGVAVVVLSIRSWYTRRSVPRLETIDEETPLLRETTEEDQSLLRPNLRAEHSLSSSASTLVDLDIVKQEIRLMRLYAGSSDSKLECSLQIQSLAKDADIPSYEALSYVWADVVGKGVLYVNGIQQTITGNLEQALRRLRYEDRDRLLWVDAVCINQAHSIERGHQVRLMGTVYSDASEVLIWLGAESHDTAQAFKDLEELSQDKHFTELEFYGSTEGDDQTWVPSPAERIDALENLLKRAYWSRIWVVQEIVRAKKATVVCGSLSIPWESCVKVRDNWPKHSRKCCNTECGIMDPRMRRVMNWINSSWRRYQEGDGDLLSRLSVARGLEATDARDKIFGVLGLVNDKTCFLDADYDSDFLVVYRDWTASMMTTTGHLDVLLHTKYHERHEGIPSWVPDWSRFDASVRFQAERLEHHRHICRSFSADGWSDLGSTLHHDGKWLRLVGHGVGSVRSIGQALVYNRKNHLTDDQNQVGAIKAWNEVLDTWAEVAGPPDALYPNGVTYGQAYWRTLISDHITEVGSYLGSRMSATDEPRYQRWREWFQRLVKQSDANKTAFYKDCLAADRDLDRFDWTIINMNYNRRLFSMQEGFIGMGPAEMEPGDHVVLLRGGRTPFVVRAVNEVAANERRGYHIIGYAYVHGLMDSELAPPENHWTNLWFC